MADGALAFAVRQLGRHEIRDLGRPASWLRAQPFDYALAVQLAAILAQLLLRLDRGDADFDPDNRPQLPVDVVRRSVSHRPRMSTVILMKPGKSGHERAQP